MKLKGVSFWLLLLVGVVSAAAANATMSERYRFRVYLDSKPLKGSPCLSERALERRLQFEIPVDSTDYPVCQEYCDKIESMGYSIVCKSRWANTVVVSAVDSSAVGLLSELPFVKGVELVWKERTSSLNYLPRQVWKSAFYDKTENYGADGNDVLPYDEDSLERSTDSQVKMLKVNRLHRLGYRGEGRMIAVIDGGFSGVDRAACFSKVNIREARSFVYPTSEVYGGTYHGACVLSLMACHDDNFMGTAPQAEYVLLCSEDLDSEYPVEEDYWAAAAEFADSMGVDVINTSLGYFVFDDPSLDNTFEEMDGKTIFISKVAEMAAQKGIVVVVSAGNEGETDWQHVTAPADAASVLAVGSSTSLGVRSTFCSKGPTYDDRVKPDVMAMGSGTIVYTSNGMMTMSSGTSFAAPLVAGSAACLSQALPVLSGKDIIGLIRQSGSLYTQPDEFSGYGIPDMYHAWELGEMLMYSRGYTEVKVDLSNLYTAPQVYVSRQNDCVRIVFDEDVPVGTTARLYDLSGRLVKSEVLKSNVTEIGLGQVASSVCLIRISAPGELIWQGKIIRK